MLFRQKDGVYYKSHEIKGFEVLTAIIMNSYIFWDMSPHGLFKTTDVSEEHVASICLPPDFTLVYFSAYSSTLKVETTCSFGPSVTFNSLLGVISQKIELFIKLNSVGRMRIFNMLK
jgi:hypothetical protein